MKNNQEGRRWRNSITAVVMWAENSSAWADPRERRRQRELDHNSPFFFSLARLHRSLSFARKMAERAPVPTRPHHRSPPRPRSSPVGSMHSPHSHTASHQSAPPASAYMWRKNNHQGFYCRTRLRWSPRKMALMLTSCSVSLQQPVALTTGDLPKGLTRRELRT